MNTVDTIINICTDYIPEKYYGKTYEYFSFEVFDGAPIHLFLICSKDDGRQEKIIITGLTETAMSYRDFVEFLKSITIDNSNPYHPVSFDLKIARERFNVDIPVTSEKKPTKFKHIACPMCGQQLIPLETVDDVEGVHDFWCDVCDIDIHVEVNADMKGE